MEKPYNNWRKENPNIYINQCLPLMNVHGYMAKGIFSIHTLTDTTQTHKNEEYSIQLIFSSSLNYLWIGWTKKKCWAPSTNIVLCNQTNNKTSTLFSPCRTFSDVLFPWLFDVFQQPNTIARQFNYNFTKLLVVAFFLEEHFLHYDLD